MPTWPTSLPQYVEAEGFTQVKTDNVIRSEQSIGPPKTRRRTTATTQPFSFKLTLTDSQKNALITFVDTTLVDGSLSFDWVDHLNNRAAATCKFKGPVSWSKKDGWWFALCNVEIMP